MEKSMSMSFLKRKLNIEDNYGQNKFSRLIFMHLRSPNRKKAERWRIESFQTVVVEKTLESPLDSKEIKSVNPKGNQPCIFTGRTDTEAPIL